MRIAAYIGLVLGLAVAIALIAWRGFDTVLAAMEALGVGVMILPVIYAPHIVGAATSWSLLFPKGRRPAFLVTLHAIWVGIAGFLDPEGCIALGGPAADTRHVARDVDRQEFLGPVFPVLLAELVE